MTPFATMRKTTALQRAKTHSNVRECTNEGERWVGKRMKSKVTVDDILNNYDVKITHVHHLRKDMSTHYE